MIRLVLTLLPPPPTPPPHSSLDCRWMKKPRCGVPDQIGGVAKFSVRKRRYALTGQRWHHKHITYRLVRLAQSNTHTHTHTHTHTEEGDFLM